MNTNAEEEEKSGCRPPPYKLITQVVDRHEDNQPFNRHVGPFLGLQTFFSYSFCLQVSEKDVAATPNAYPEQQQQRTCQNRTSNSLRKEKN